MIYCQRLRSKVIYLPYKITIPLNLTLPLSSLENMPLFSTIYYDPAVTAAALQSLNGPRTFTHSNSSSNNNNFLNRNKNKSKLKNKIQKHSIHPKTSRSTHSKDNTNMQTLHPCGGGCGQRATVRPSVPWPGAAAAEDSLVPFFRGLLAPDCCDKDAACDSCDACSTTNKHCSGCGSGSGSGSGCSCSKCNSSRDQTTKSIAQHDLPPKPTPSAEYYKSIPKPSSPSQRESSFTPRFDLRELKDSYRLDGELPGVNQKDIDIEFTDSNTLSVKDYVEREYDDNVNDIHESTEMHDDTIDSENASTSSSSSSSSGPASPRFSGRYRQPTVEDGDDDDEGSSSTTTISNNNNTSDAEIGSRSAPEPEPSTADESKSSYHPAKKLKTTNNPSTSTKYWASERPMGKFHRTFTFSSPIDQDSVKASLVNGILTIVVPKESAVVRPKKIVIEV